MKRCLHILLLLSIFIPFTSCFEREDYTNDTHANFEALWKIIDERYCFFDYKNIDWNAVHDKYEVKINNSLDRYQLFDILGLMLAELQDGHTNLISTFNTSRFWSWYEDYPANFNSVVHKNYLGSDYKIAGGFKFLVFPDNIGYVYYSDFSSPVSEVHLDEMFQYFKDCKSIIFDIRNNTGGSLAYSEIIAARFIEEKMLVGFIVHKTGIGHNDFSDPYPINLEPSKRIKWLRPVAVLTNRSCYSAANDFVGKMRIFPNVTIIGDKTGGGCGLPFNSELPNGWGVRFSSSPILNADKELTEFGIDPDIKIDIKEEDQLNGFDTIIEEAILFLNEKTLGTTPTITNAEYKND